MRRASVFAVVFVLALMTIGTATVAAGTGFDQYGYNDTARVFNGLADGVDRNLDGTVWGDPTYAKDKLVMKWNGRVGSRQ